MKKQPSTATLTQTPTSQATSLRFSTSAEREEDSRNEKLMHFTGNIFKKVCLYTYNVKGKVAEKS
jgi:hypothetical protein